MLRVIEIASIIRQRIVGVVQNWNVVFVRYLGKGVLNAFKICCLLRGFNVHRDIDENDFHAVFGAFPDEVLELPDARFVHRVVQLLDG